MKTNIIILLFVLSVALSFGQTVTNTSYVNKSGEKVLRFEITVPLTLDKAWELCSTDEGLKKWMAPLVHIELKAGGHIITNYNVTKALDDTTSIRLPIASYIEKEMMVLKVKLNYNFSAAVRKEDDHLFEIIQLKKIDNMHTSIVSSMVGFGEGDEWEKTYQFFLKGNAWTCEQLVNVFAGNKQADIKSTTPQTKTKAK